MSAAHQIELPASLTVAAYPDPVVEAHGFGPEHPYIEAVVTSSVGPSTLLMWKRLARHVTAAGGPVTVDTDDLLACLGLSGTHGRNGVGARTVARMVSFDLARRGGPNGNYIAVRLALAPLAGHRLDRLPATARRYHDQTTSR